MDSICTTDTISYQALRMGTIWTTYHYQQKLNVKLSQETLLKPL